MINFEGEMGICPYCGSDDVNYGIFELEDEGGSWIVVCNSCNQTYHEVHDFVFVGNYGEPIEGAIK